MNVLEIKPSEISPQVIFDIENNIFLIKGKSILSNAVEFYSPVLEWLEGIEGELKGRTDFVFDLDYFNITSSKRFLFILYKLKQLRDAGEDVNIVWYTSDGDNDMREIGEDFSFMVDIPFQFINKTLEPELVS